MKHLYFIIAVFIALTTSCHAQDKNTSAIEVMFDNTTILLNNKPAFDYTKTKNKFVISDLNGSALVAGKIFVLENDEYATKMFFVSLKKEFYNKKLISAKDLINALCEYGAINQNLEIITEKLQTFIETNNEIKSFPLKKQE